MNLPESSKKILEKSLGGNEALEQAERAQAVLENIFVGVWSVELDEGKPPRMYGDARMRELLGVADKQLTAEELYHAWFDRIHPDYVALVEDAVRQMVDGKHAEVRYPWIHPTLGEMMVRCGGRRSPFYKGGVRVSGVHRDVSALLSNALTVHADETPVEAKVETRPSLFTRDWESRVSRQFWEEISRMTPDPIFVLDAENEWRCCYSNPAHQDLVGVDPTNRTLQENFGSSLGAAMMRENEKVLAAGAPVQAFEALYNATKGGRHYRIAKVPLVFPDGHRYVLGHGTDVTELYLAHLQTQCHFAVQDAVNRDEDASTALEKVLDAVLETTPWIRRILYRSRNTTQSSICCRKEEGRMAAVRVQDGLLEDPAWCAYLDGLDPKSVKICPDVSQILPKAMDYGLHACVSFCIEHKGALLGQMSVFLDRRAPRERDVDALVAILSDVSLFYYRRYRARLEIAELERERRALEERRRLEMEALLKESQAAERAKSFFLASMSHEIRTPLNALLGLAAELDHDDVTKERCREYARTIGTAGRALLNLINDVLDMSKLEAGQMRIVPAETDIGALFEECRTIFEPNCVKSGLTMKVSVASDMPVVSLDRGRIRQILFNLLGNAIKFTPAGSITLSATIRPIAENLGELHLAVADTGVGIAAEDRERVFGMFEQASGLRGTRVAQSGTGLGLALCRRLVECMGGKITLESELGKGSVFTVVLPNVPIISRNEKGPQGLAANTKPAVSYAGRVLVVDDVALNLMVIKLMLQRADIDHVVASSADKALEILEGDPHVTAVLTDLWMPHMSGVELATHIRGRYAGRNLKIAAVTADTDIVGSDDAKVFDAVLLKPVTVSQICKFLGV